MVRNKDIVADYREYLEQTGKSANTVKAYVHDVGAFVSWFEQTTGDEFSPGIGSFPEGLRNKDTSSHGRIYPIRGLSSLNPVVVRPNQ